MVVAQFEFQRAGIRVFLEMVECGDERDEILASYNTVYRNNPFNLRRRPFKVCGASTAGAGHLHYLPLHLAPDAFCVSSKKTIQMAGAWLVSHLWLRRSCHP